MCGFAGFLAFGVSPMNAVDRHRVLVAMGDAIAHRGPDDAQYYDDGRLALVYRRLSIIDVQGGRQPFFNERGDELLVANGEIYNHASLRARLSSDHRFSSRSDCEVLLHGFEQWGSAALEQAQGMFALAHWDIRRQQLTLARDRLGIKPLYVCHVANGLLFGSELKALLAHPACPRELAWPDVDRQAISQQPSASYVRGVELLPGGEFLVADLEGRTRAQSYWRLEDHLGTAPFGTDARRYTRAYAELLEEATLQHLQRDVGAGIHLSGGVDSSLIAAIVGAHDKSVACFSVVERASYLHGDVDAARSLTRRLGLPWLPVRFDYRSILDEMRFGLEHVEEAVWMMDSPRLDLEWLFKAELHRAARKHFPDLKVVLLGQGADEFAGGYSRCAHAPRQCWSDYLDEDVLPHLARDESLQGLRSTQLWPLGRLSAAPGSAAPYHRFMLLLTRQLQHHNLWHEDRTSSWHSLEARVPFLDHRLVELLASVPAPLHEELFWDKRIVRDALAGFMPGHTLTQSKLAFLDEREAGSMDVITHALLKAVAPAFREKYLLGGGGPFDADKVDDVIGRALSRGPQRAAATREALQCIAISIFERQLREPCTARSAPRHVGLGCMQESHWKAWANDMPARPVCRHAWHPAECIELRPGVEVLMPVHAPQGIFRLYREGAVAGEIVLPEPSSWGATLLKNLGTQAAAEFTVQDWLDEFEIGLDALSQLLDILFHQGVIRPRIVPVGAQAPMGTAQARARELAAV
jgi:asparagine synthase (glutamine-hydrolysing)